MKGQTIKRQAKYTEQQILEENSSFYNDMISKNYVTKPSKTKRNLLIWATPSLATVAALILLIVFLWPPVETNEARKYLQENEVSESFATSINSHLEYLSLNLGETYEIVSQARIYDSQYNDTLFYRIMLVSFDGLELVEVYFYINTNYTQQKQPTGDIITSTAGGFPIIYTESKEGDGIYTFTYAAQTAYKGVTIYLEYEQTSLSEESNFFNLFGGLIKTK